MFRNRTPQYRIPLLLLIFMLFICASLLAQDCSPLYKKVYGGNGNDQTLFLLATADKGAVVAGRTTSQTNGDFDGFLMKLTQSGLIEWSKNYGGGDIEEVRRVRVTADGGYLALGQTKAAGGGFPFLFKTNKTGDLQWARQFSTEGASLNGADVVVLKDNSIALLLNENDSTDAANGIVCKLAATGSLTWAKTFDHGKADAFGTIAANGDSLYVGGYATLENRDAILMNLRVSDGSLFWVKKMDRKTDREEETVQVATTSEGLAFSVTTSLFLHKDLGFAPPRSMGMFKRKNDGTYTEFAVGNVYSAVSYDVEGVVTRMTQNGQFLFLVNDKARRSGTRMVKMDNGYSEYGRELFEPYPIDSRTYGLDTSGDGGFWAAGYYRNWDMPTEKLVVYKMDKFAMAGSCIRQSPGVHMDDNEFKEHPFNWTHMDNAALSAVSFTLNNAILDFQQVSSCDSTYCPLPAVNDECKATYLMYLRSDNKVRLLDTEQTADGGTIVVGQKYLRPFVAKISAKGVLEWSKTYTQFQNEMLAKRIMPTNDGNYLVLGANANFAPHAWAGGSVLMKINDRGEVLWSHAYEGISMDIYTAVATPDGGYIVGATGSVGTGSTYPYLFRVSATGQMVWKHRITYQTADPIYRSFVLDGNDLYTLSNIYLHNSIFRLEKWNATSGAPVWQKRFYSEKSRFNADLLTKIGDTLYVGLFEVMENNITGYDAHATLAKFDTAGNAHGAFTLMQPNYSMIVYSYESLPHHPPIGMVQTADNNFVVAQQVQPFSDRKLRLTKFSTSGTVLWSREYPKLSKHMVRTIKTDGSNLTIGGIVDLYGSNMWHDFSAFILKTDGEGKAGPNAAGLCESTPATAVAKPRLPLESVDWYLGFWTNSEASVINDFPVTFKPEPVDLEVDLKCYTPVTCNDVRINGPAESCSPNEVLEYALQRNVGCTAGAKWVVDTAMMQILALTDSSIKLKARRSGITNISALVISGCSRFTPNIELNISNGSPRLNLGADRSLCAGNNIRLNAGKGYSSYLWQDGSTDSSLLVSKKGTYWVEVVDVCGKKLRDSVSISDWVPVGFQVGPDRVKCNNDTVHLQAPVGYTSYTWSNSNDATVGKGSSLVVNPMVTTEYYLKAEQAPGCFAYDTVRVNAAHSATINLGADTSFCAGQKMQLTVNSSFAQVLWSTGEVGRNIWVDKQGSYRVMATTAEGCASFDTINVLRVHALPEPKLHKGTVLCAGTSKMLNPGAFAKYMWHDGSTQREFVAKAIGTYHVRVTDNNGCSISDTMHINELRPNPGKFLPADTVICSYSEFTLKPTRQFSSYSWSNGSSRSSITVKQAGYYVLEVADELGCTGKDTITVREKDCLSGVFVPTAFSPNGDGKNDQLRPLVFGPVSNVVFSVYNRWGAIVFTTNDANRAWDGTLRGKQMDTGIFVWTCTYILADGTEQNEKGTVMLIR